VVVDTVGDDPDPSGTTRAVDDAVEETVELTVDDGTVDESVVAFKSCALITVFSSTKLLKIVTMCNIFVAIKRHLIMARNSPGLQGLKVLLAAKTIKK
jgi:hypothetical protein